MCAVGPYGSLFKSIKRLIASQIVFELQCSPFIKLFGVHRNGLCCKGIML